MLKFLTVFAVFVFSGSLHAVEVNKKADAHERAVAQFLSPYVYSLDRQVYTYNWFNGSSSRKEGWLKPFSATSDLGIKRLQQSSKQYWLGFCAGSEDARDCKGADQVSRGLENTYGPGLYLSPDPVATIHYGGGAGWVLMQIRLPIGLRVLDVVRDSQVAVPKDVSKHLTSLGCPAEWAEQGDGINAILSATNVSDEGTRAATPRCLLSLRRILKDLLRIEGFYYPYTASAFTECASPISDNVTTLPAGITEHSGAFVLADSTGFKADDVRVFNTRTRDASDERIRIQSLFYKADADSPDLMEARRGFSLPAILKISRANPPMSTLGPLLPQQGEPMPSIPLLWEDLDEQPFSSELGSWVNKNLFGCGGLRDYKASTGK